MSTYLYQTGLASLVRQVYKNTAMSQQQGTVVHLTFFYESFADALSTVRAAD